MDSQFNEITQWMREQAEGNPFAEIAVNLTIHEGNIVFIERGLKTKYKCTKAEQP